MACKSPKKGYGAPKGIADGQHKVPQRRQAPFLGLGGWEQLRAKAHGKAIPRRGCLGRAFRSLFMRSR